MALVSRTETNPATTMARIPLVSVIVPTFDRVDALREALQSIRALEGPDLALEIIVGDNGSNPETPKVAAAFSARYVRTDRNGCAAGRNVALDLVQGDFVAFLDDDDVFTASHIRPHLAKFAADPDLGIVFGRVQGTDEKLKPIDAPWPYLPPEDGDWLMFLLRGYYPQVGATVLRASLAQQLGPMIEDCEGPEDWDWQIRAVSASKAGYVDVACVLFRQRPPGPHDKMKWRRMMNSVKVFLRHAKSNWRKFSSPIDFLRAYAGVVLTYYQYFLDAAEYRLRQGDVKGARNALWRAVCAFPTRAVKIIARRRDFRSTVLTMPRGF